MPLPQGCLLSAHERAQAEACVPGRDGAVLLYAVLLIFLNTCPDCRVLLPAVDDIIYNTRLL